MSPKTINNNLADLPSAETSQHLEYKFLVLDDTLAIDQPLSDSVQNFFSKSVHVEPFSQFDNFQLLMDFHNKVCTLLGRKINNLLLIKRKLDTTGQNNLPLSETAYLILYSKKDIQKWHNGKIVSQWVNGFYYDDDDSKTLAYTLAPHPILSCRRYAVKEDPDGELSLLVCDQSNTPLFYQRSADYSMEEFFKIIEKLERQWRTLPHSSLSIPADLSVSTFFDSCFLTGKIGTRARTFHFDKLGLTSRLLFLPNNAFEIATNMLYYNEDYFTRNDIPKWRVRLLNTNTLLHRQDMADIATYLVSPLCKTNTWAPSREGSHYSLWDMLISGQYSRYATPQSLASCWDSSPEITRDTVIGHAFYTTHKKRDPKDTNSPELMGTVDQLWPLLKQEEAELESNPSVLAFEDRWFVMVNGSWTLVMSPNATSLISTLVTSTSEWVGNHHLSLRVDTQANSWRVITAPQLSITSADGTGLPTSVLAAINESIENCSFIFQSDMRAILTDIAVKIIYDPLHICLKFERGSFNWMTRCIYLDDVGIHHSLIHELAYLIDSEAGPDLDEALALDCPLGLFLFRSHFEWYDKSDTVGRLALSRFVTENRTFNRNQSVLDQVFWQTTLPAIAAETIPFLQEQFAGLVEEFAFWKLLKRGASMEGVFFDTEIYKRNTFDSSQTKFLKTYGENLDRMISDRIGEIAYKLAHDCLDDFHWDKVSSLLHALESKLDKNDFTEKYSSVVSSIPDGYW